MASLRNRLSRARYFRGHGVHSPFVYGLVRGVFMSRRLLGADTSLRDALTEAGVPVRRALELQNLMTYCGYRTFAVVGGGAEKGIATTAELGVVLLEAPEVAVLRCVEEASEHGATVAIMSPYADPCRERMCRALVAAHGSTSVDNRGYVLLFHDKYLPKQHFRI